MTAVPNSPIWTRLRNLMQQQQKKIPNNSSKLFKKDKLGKQRSYRKKPQKLNFAPLPLLPCEHDSKGIPRNRRFHALVLPEALFKLRKRSMGPSELLVAPLPKPEVAAQRAVSQPLKDKPELNTDLKYAKGMQKVSGGKKNKRKEEKEKSPKVWHLNFQSLFNLFQPQLKRSNLQTVCRVNATQSSALKTPFFGNSRKRRKSRNIATLSFRLPDL